MSQEESKKRLDMKESLYTKMLEYASSHGVEGRTRGERVLKAVEFMYDEVSSSEGVSMVALNDEVAKKMKLFQMVGILDEHDMSQAMNEALEFYIQEHKELLAQKVAEL
jgi:hypothetical protein